MDRRNVYNKQVHEFKIPRIFLFRTKHKLTLIGKNIAKLQKDFLDWQRPLRSKRPREGGDVL